MIKALIRILSAIMWLITSPLICVLVIVLGFVFILGGRSLNSLPKLFGVKE